MICGERAQKRSSNSRAEGREGRQTAGVKKGSGVKSHRRIDSVRGDRAVLLLVQQGPLGGVRPAQNLFFNPRNQTCIITSSSEQNQKKKRKKNKKKTKTTNKTKKYEQNYSNHSKRKKKKLNNDKKNHT